MMKANSWPIRSRTSSYIVANEDYMKEEDASFGTTHPSETEVLVHTAPPEGGDPPPYHIDDDNYEVPDRLTVAQRIATIEGRLQASPESVIVISPRNSRYMESKL